MEKEYKFFGSKNSDLKVKNKIYKGIETLGDLYEALSDIWCKETCAERMRDKWSEENKTLGQCSITSFLVQDIFGGKVYGIPLEDGNFHCYNEVDGLSFDLTSEQFKGKKLNYENNPEQSREVHFSKGDKKGRYEYLIKKMNEKYL